MFAVPVFVVVKEIAPRAPVDMVGVASVLSVNVAAPVEVVGFTVTVSTAGCQIPRLLRFRVLTEGAARSLMPFALIAPLPVAVTSQFLQQTGSPYQPDTAGRSSFLGYRHPPRRLIGLGGG